MLILESDLPASLTVLVHTQIPTVCFTVSLKHELHIMIWYDMIWYIYIYTVYVYTYMVYDTICIYTVYIIIYILIWYIYIYILENGSSPKMASILWYRSSIAPNLGRFLEAQLRVDELLKEYSEERVPWPCSGEAWRRYAKVIARGIEHDTFEQFWTCLDSVYSVFMCLEVFVTTKWIQIIQYIIDHHSTSPNMTWGRAIPCPMPRCWGQETCHVGSGLHAWRGAGTREWHGGVPFMLGSSWLQLPSGMINIDKPKTHQFVLVPVGKNRHWLDRSKRLKRCSNKLRVGCAGCIHPPLLTLERANKQG